MIIKQEVNPNNQTNLNQQKTSQIPTHQRSREEPTLTTHRSRPERSFSSRVLSPLSPSRTEKTALLTASSWSWRPCERAALRCRRVLSARKKGIGERLCFLSFLPWSGNQLAQSKLLRAPGQHQRRLWLLGGMEWSAPHQASYGSGAGSPPHATFGECASIFRSRRKRGSGGRRCLQAS